MRRGSRRRLLALLTAASLGTVFQVFLPGGCADYALATGLSAVDFCSVFNCTQGSFFNFCAPVRLLVDCPE